MVRSEYVIVRVRPSTARYVICVAFRANRKSRSIRTRRVTFGNFGSLRVIETVDNFTGYGRTAPRTGNSATGARCGPAARVRARSRRAAWRHIFANGARRRTTRFPKRPFEKRWYRCNVNATRGSVWFWTSTRKSTVARRYEFRNGRRGKRMANFSGGSFR